MAASSSFPETGLLSLGRRLVFFGAALVALAGPAPRTDQVTVPAGTDLQAAIDRARPGDTLVLAAGATYVGNFVLRAFDGDSFITIRSERDPLGPLPGQRVLPVHAARMATLRSPNAQPALRTAPRAHHWRLQMLEFAANAGGNGDIVALGDGGPDQQSLADVPHDLAIERCYIHGDPDAGQKRGIALNSASTTIADSYIAEIKAVAQDAQAIAGWNGPGPYTIENNYLEASGENLMLGGSDPAIAGLVTEDVTVRRNHLVKPLAWRGQTWQVKNLFELKNARRVLVEYNLMEQVWKEAQVGYAVLLTPRNQDGRAPWATVEDVTLRGNVIRHAGGAIVVTGEDTTFPSGPARRIRIVDNLVYDVDVSAWGGTGAFLLVGNGPSDLSIEHNTVRQSGNIMIVFGGTKADPQKVPGVVFRANLIRHNQYGVQGADHAVGLDTLETYLPGAVFQGNAIAGGESRRYPPGNTFLDASDFDRQFVDVEGGDFRLRRDSALRGAAPDKRDMGADIAAIQRALGVRFRPIGG
jgi:hypothetical protein